MLAAIALAAAVSGTPPEFGLWLTQDKDALVRIGPCESNPARLCGVIERLIDPPKKPGGVVRDENNPDARLRGRPLIGITVLNGFVPKDARWVGGRLYNPDDGRTWSSKLKLDPDGALQVSGCFFGICSVQTWTRAR